MTTSTQPREEVFPGYQLTERIGSGGYAEVWRVRAPGGIDKAAKIVYGYYDEQLAAQEMKAMERVKDVRHPFVLSLERFEVVDNRLVILTELADMSLEQRARQCRAEGLPGIPREELLRFIADAAEALDYLAQRHSLQHLDIKPANLLISGDHIKVADFGLVKELASRTQNSMVAGMTPTYSSPEMFDDTPSAHSDQYSLAIVYQEMLTGVLPFPGRTAAQLANQHLRTPPQLSPLSERDRPAVAKALAKNATDRFPSCRAFVKALTDAGQRIVVQSSESRPTNGHTRASGSAPSVASPNTLARGANAEGAAIPLEVNGHAIQQTEPKHSGMIETQCDRPSRENLPIDRTIVDVAIPELASTPDAVTPTLYIAAGGVGIRLLCRLRELLARQEKPSQTESDVEMMAIDTDRAELKEACSSNWNNPLPASDTLCLPLRLPQEYRENGGSNLEWLSHRWLYNIPRSLETRGYRPLGRLALVDNVDKTISLINRKLERLTAMPADPNPSEPREVRVIVLAGMGGGTGGGIAIDVANAARSRIEAAGHRAEIQGIFVCTCLGGVSASPLSVANTYALLCELQYAAEFGNQGSTPNAGSSGPLESARRPFDLVYCLPAKQRSPGASDDALCAIARQLSLTASDGARGILEACRKSATPREQVGSEPLLLRSYGCAPLSGPKRNRIDSFAKQLSDALERYWLADTAASEWNRLTRTRDSEPSLRNPPPAAPSDPAEPKPAPPPTLAERLRPIFIDHLSTRFAFEVLSRVTHQSTLRGAYRASLQSSNDPTKVAEMAALTLAAIARRRSASPAADGPPCGAEESIAKALAPTSNRVVTKVIDAIEQLPAGSAFDTTKMDLLTKTECAAAAAELLKRQSDVLAESMSPDLEAGLRQTLGEADVDLLRCGFDRRTFAFLPQNNTESALLRDLAKVRPEIATVPTETAEEVVFCEGSGISSSAFMQGLERVYPDIAEAASRFFTRSDIHWRAKPR
jgi:serine/threonine protein kinase